MGQRFATINNLEEQNEVITLLEDAGNYICITISYIYIIISNLYFFMKKKIDERGNVWIGGIDVLQNDNFVWVSMALDFNFTNWAKDYPSTDPDSNCALQTMTMQGSWGVPGWETAACHTGHYCICED